MSFELQLGTLYKPGKMHEFKEAVFDMITTTRCHNFAPLLHQKKIDSLQLN